MTIDRLIEQGAEAGLKPEEVFDSTLRTLAAYFRGSAKTYIDRWRLGMWTAWQTAAMTRAKKMPSLKQALSKLDDQPVKRQSAAEIWKNIEMINAIHGGEDKRGAA